MGKINNKIKIMYISSCLDIGGIEMLVFEICKKLNHKKYFPMVCSFQKNGKLKNEFEKIGIPTYTIKKKEGIDYTLPLKLIRVFEKEKIDILHTHNASPWLYAGIAKMFSRTPRLVHTEQIGRAHV